MFDIIIHVYACITECSPRVSDDVHLYLCIYMYKSKCIVLIRCAMWMKSKNRYTNVSPPSVETLVRGNDMTFLTHMFP